MSGMDRRSFLKKGALAGAAFSTFAVGSSGRVLGANDRIRVAVAGIHGRGRSHMNAFAGMDGVEVSHLVDPDSNLFDSRSKQVKEKGGNTPKCVQDIREVLDDDSVDVVSIATCNHWHSLMTVWACQAGKDVYVEKPMSHNVFEGRQAVEAARKYDCIVQHGTQSRSSGGHAKEAAAARSGKYGKLLVAKGYCCKPRWSIGFDKQEAPPAHLDWDLWLGPAPWQDYHGNYVHYDWHWFWDTGNGDVGNQGVHEMDKARWALGKTLPKKVWAVGGRFGYVDQGETPNTQLAVFDYGDQLLVFETRGLVGGESKMGRKVDNEYYTTEGMIAHGKFHPKGGGDPEPLGDFDIDIDPGSHFGNFMEAVRENDRSALNAEIEEGHYSSALCHLGNISYMLGEQVPFSEMPTRSLDNDVVEKSWETIKKNLGWGVGLDLNKMTCQVGPTLTFDADHERFVGRDAKRANLLLTRPYREPFVVPEKV